MTPPATTSALRHRLHHLHLLLLLLLLLLRRVSALNADGILLLSFKYSVLSDPLGVLADWNYDDPTPCAWTGVACADSTSDQLYDPNRVVGLALPGSQILGSITADLGLIEHLRSLDLSGNYLNGSLPAQLFNATELVVLTLADNELSGELPDLFAQLPALQALNLSDNAFGGPLPPSLAASRNLTVLSLANNYISGELPAGFGHAQVLDFSSNLLNGSLNSNFTGAGGALRYLNLSANRLSGGIPPELAVRIPVNATVDLSYNNLTGPVPEGGLLYQKMSAFAGNPGLCGKPLKNPCVIPSALSVPPKASDSTPAIAAFPNTLDGPSAGGGSSSTGNTSSVSGPAGRQQTGLKAGAIAGIIVGDIAGVGVLAVVFFYIYHLKKRKKKNAEMAAAKKAELSGGGEVVAGKAADSSPESGRSGWSCIGKIGGGGGRAGGGAAREETSDSTGSGSESDEDKVNRVRKGPTGSLVTVDGETELEMETLLKASAYILGATGSSIVYKAVMEDGTALAVRRIGETGMGRFKDFENQVRLYAKLRHPNLVRIRGFYWGEDEKLLIYDYAPNGGLANLTYKKMGSSSPLNLTWEARLKIARGVARGLSYLHDKKHVHGNLKPGNILLGPDMDAQLGDYGLERLLLSGESSSKAAIASARLFGSKRSTVSQTSLPDASPAVAASPGQSSGAGASPYLAPESLKNLNSNPKSDVYSFGVVLLELLTGKVFTEKELVQWTTGFIAEDRVGVLRMVDVGLRSEVEGREEALLACFRLGFSCASVSPQRRPSMKEAVQVLDKVPSSSSHPSSSSYY